MEDKMIIWFLIGVCAAQGLGIAGLCMLIGRCMRCENRKIEETCCQQEEQPEEADEESLQNKRRAPWTPERRAKHMAALAAMKARRREMTS